MLAFLKLLLEKMLTPQEDLTRTYRPARDWTIPIERVLEELPPEALEPAGERRKCRCRKGVKKCDLSASQ